MLPPVNEILPFVGILVTVAVSSASAAAYVGRQVRAVNRKAESVRVELAGHIDTVRRDLSARIDAVQESVTNRMDGLQDDLVAFQVEWPRQLNGTYQRAEACKLMHQALPAVLATSDVFKGMIGREITTAIDSHGSHRSQ